MVVTSFNEFSFLIWYYAPYAYYHYLNGELVETNSRIGTKALFYFSPNHNEKKKYSTKLHNCGVVKYKDKFYNHKIGRKILNWEPPPYKQFYKNRDFVFDKPILTLNNKCSIEWKRGIFNYFNKESLKMIFDEFYDKYQIVYIRPPHGNTSSYQHDQRLEIKNIGDLELINKYYSNIITIEDLMGDYPNKTYNELQMMVLANSEKHIASAGGEAAIASYFGGDVLIYRAPNVISSSRGVWHTGSYLKLFSGANILGYDNYNDLLDSARSIW